MKNLNDKYEVKLLYTSNMPIILQSGLISNIYAITTLLYDKFKNNFFVELIATYDRGTPTGGLIFWISRPTDFWEITIVNFIHILI